MSITATELDFRRAQRNNYWRMLIDRLPNNDGATLWLMHSELSCLENATWLTLTKNGKAVHRTKDVEEMAVYMQALIALEGKQ